MLLMHFPYSLRMGDSPSFRHILNSMFCATFNWNWSNGPREEGFFNVVIIFTILLLSHLGKDAPSFDYKLQFTSLKMLSANLVQVKILKFCECIFSISLLSALGKWHSPSFIQT